jgi:uncharacterized membrane protein
MTRYLRSAVLIAAGLLVLWRAGRDPAANGALYAVGVVLLVLGILRLVRTLRRA